MDKEIKTFIITLIVGMIIGAMLTGSISLIVMSFNTDVSTVKDVGDKHYHIKYNGKGWETKEYTFKKTTYEEDN